MLPFAPVTLGARWGSLLRCHAATALLRWGDAATAHNAGGDAGLGTATLGGCCHAGDMLPRLCYAGETLPRPATLEGTPASVLLRWEDAATLGGCWETLGLEEKEEDGWLATLLGWFASRLSPRGLLTCRQVC